MRKDAIRWIAAMLLALVLPLTACGGGQEQQTEQPETTQEETQQQETTPPAESSDEATISAEDQPNATDSITVQRAVAPEGGWLVVHLNDDGKPGKRIGLVQLQQGENTNVEVPIDPEGEQLTDELITAVHMDTGKKGEFEFDPAKFEKAMEEAPEGQEPNMEGILDPPYFVDGMEAATMFRVK